MARKISKKPLSKKSKKKAVKKVTKKIELDDGVVTDLVLKQTVYKIQTYDGSCVNFRRPTGIEKSKWLTKLDDIAEKVNNGEKVKPDADYVLTREFLEQLGLDADVFDNFEEQHQLDIVLMVQSPKKA